MLYCDQCDTPIGMERCMVMGYTPASDCVLCAECSAKDKTPMVVFTEHSHKCDSHLVIAKGAEQVRQAKRAHRRAR